MFFPPFLSTRNALLDILADILHGSRRMHPK